MEGPMRSTWRIAGTAAGAIALLASACGGGEQPEAACQPTGTALQVSAQDISFDTDCLAAPAGQPFTIEFQNNEQNVSHNVAIYTDLSAGEELFVGEIFPGPDSRTYRVPAMDPGTYFFRCDVHPGQMTGTFVVE